MGSRGPAPKPVDRLTGHGARKRRENDMRVIEVEPASQPKLPPLFVPDENGELKKAAWPAATRRWWKMWGDSPLSADFTDNDWSELLDTALIHARHWQGDTKAAAELRIRSAKFGATPEDRARLKIAFAQAEEAESKREVTSGARGRWSDLRVVDG